MVQESITNALKHARASHIQVGLSVAGNTLELTVLDDGVGFDLPSVREKSLTGAALGLLGMEERVRLVGGQLKILAEPGKGTEVRAVIPFEE